MVESENHIHLKIDIEDFETTFKEFETKHKKYIALFKGSIDPETKVNWCPDCVAVEEPLKKIFYPLAKEKNIPILEVSVGLRESWKKETHPLRVHKKIALKQVPTLAYVTPVGIIKQLEEEQILDLDLLKEFLED